MLGNLTISDCPQLKSLHIKASWLHTFRYHGVLPCRELRLHDAMFNFRKGPGYRFANHDFNVFLHGIRYAKKLTLCRWTFEEITKDTWLKHVKVVKLDEFRSQEDEISLAKKLKEVFSAEPKIVAEQQHQIGSP
ncbi:hypothetical protein Ddye_028544 [Dipteronia dyeriana]|uniref:Uncharacterized protein n=1 Tax=Dipteronia dyeriana TaxID=168575 RepID=A0AAD9WKL9_9ROSI|nr:hypothetical protein Ddye_028544 [Dipteronia dyeriana]